MLIMLAAIFFAIGQYFVRNWALVTAHQWQLNWFWLLPAIFAVIIFIYRPAAMLPEISFGVKRPVKGTMKPGRRFRSKPLWPALIIGLMQAGAEPIARAMRLNPRGATVTSIRLAEGI